MYYNLVNKVIIMTVLKKLFDWRKRFSKYKKPNISETVDSVDALFCFVKLYLKIITTTT